MEGGDGKVLLMAETGRKLSRERSGDKSGLSILGGGEIRRLVLDPNRSKPALILLQQEGTKELHWSGHRFWVADPGGAWTVEPCVLQLKLRRLTASYYSCRRKRDGGLEGISDLTAWQGRL